MTERGQLAYETESVRLYPAKTFYQALLHQPEDVRQSLQMKRLGLLLRQLHPHEEQLLLDVSGTSVTNADFKIRAKLHSQQPVPDEVRKKVELLEAAALGEEDGILFQRSDFEQKTVDSVYWLLNELRPEFEQRRKAAIGEYCREIGIFDSDEDSGDGSDDEGDGGGSAGHHGRKPFGRNITIPNVSKL